MTIYVPFILFKSSRVWFEKYKSAILLFHNLRNKIVSWLPYTFFKIRKEYPDFFEKCPNCGHLWVKFLIYSAIFKSFGEKTDIFPRGVFLICVVDNCLLKAPNSRKLPCPKEFLVMHLFILFKSNSYWFEKYKWNINCYCAIEKRVDS